MCAIAGILNLAAAPAPTEAALRRMLAMVRHRGPDEFGVLLAPQVALGNARLSIVDLTGGQQPITNEDGTLWIVFNGEIFNHVELRAELEARGHRFTTHCDTEVVLHLFEEHGPDCLQRLNGQFAIAIWDQRDRSLFLARDRVGVRPLFYTQAANQFIFASEIKSILAVSPVAAKIDPVALEEIFTYWSPLAPRSAFRGIPEVPPGHYLVAKAGKISVRAYWQLEFAEPAAEKSATEYEEEFHHLLTDATRIRLRADVPVGAYLSGGLDSSLIAALVRQLGVSRLDTFSIAFDDQKFDESQFQREMAAFLGSEHQVVQATHADIGNIFPAVTWHTEVPVLRTAPGPMFLLSKLVRDRGLKVVLSGEGADEFLGGYDIFKEAKIRRFWARQPDSQCRPRLLARLYPDIAALQTAGPAYLKAFFGHGLTATDAADYSHAIRWRNNRRNCRLFAPDFAAAIAAQQNGGSAGPGCPASFQQWGELQRAQYLEISVFLSQYLLAAQGDRVAMAHSVEGRHPFLDVRVMEFCNRLPARFKLRGLTDKFLLRQVGRKYLPEKIWRRRKRPYRAPIHRSFFHATTPDYVRELLSESAVAAAGIFNPVAIRQLVAKLESGRAVGEADDMAVMGVLSTQLVHRQFVQAFRAAEPLAAADPVKVCRLG